VHGGSDDAPNPAEGFAVEIFAAEVFGQVEVFIQIITQAGGEVEIVPAGISEIDVIPPR
jgi:hypothetical protein